LKATICALQEINGMEMAQMEASYSLLVSEEEKEFYFKATY
jgi:hypothetical protein